MSVGTVALVLLLQAGCVGAGERFSATAELETVLNTEAELLQGLQDYVSAEQERLRRLSRLVEHMAAHSAEVAGRDPDTHLENPINAFHLLKKMSTDWFDGLRDFAESDPVSERKGVIEESLDKMADLSEDLAGSVKGLLRVQDTYSLAPSNMARGKLIRDKDSIPMSAHDCYQIGKVAFDNQDYYHTIQWMQEALRMRRREETESVPEATILKYLSYSLFQKGNLYHAKNMTERWLSLTPNDINAISNLDAYNQMILDRGDQSGSRKVLRNTRDLPAHIPAKDFLTYEALCRGEDAIPRQDTHTLSCQLRFWHPAFYLHPLREEILSIEPWVAVYHNMISPADIEHLRNTGRAGLRRAGVLSQADGKRENSEVRVSQSVWLKSSHTQTVRKINHRLSALTNLSSSIDENLQIANYGIGGHFEPHYDAYNTENPNRGNRILTAICYLTDVAAGGATVFVRAGVKVMPKRGACAVWYNVKQTGEIDAMSLHAGCPVLAGSKWIALKWFRKPGCSVRSISPSES